MKLTQFIIALTLVYLAACSANNHHKKLRKHAVSAGGAEPWVIFDAGSSGTRLYLVDMATFLTNYETHKVESQYFRLSDVLDKKKSMGECKLGETPFGTIPTKESNTPELKAKFYGECLGEKIKQALTIGKVQKADKVQKILIESTAGARQSRGGLSDTEYSAVKTAIALGIQTQCGDLCEANKVEINILSGRFEGLYGYISAFLNYKPTDKKELVGDQYKKNAIYMEVGGASIQYAFGINNEDQFSSCIKKPLLDNKACLSEIEKTEQRRFSKSCKNCAKKSSKGVIDFQWKSSNTDLINKQTKKVNIFSKSFLGNANNELVNLLEASGYYQYCTRYEPEYDTSPEKQIEAGSTELQKIVDAKLKIIAGTSMIKKDSNGMIFKVKSTQADTEGKPTTTYFINDKYDYKTCYNIIEKVRDLRDTTKAGQKFKCQWNYLNAATHCGEMNKQSNTLIINNNGPKNLLTGTTSFANLGAYNDAIYLLCNKDSTVVATTKYPAEFIANACLYSMYSINQISRLMHTKREDFEGKIEIVKSADWYIGSLYFQKNAGVNSEQWELNDTNLKEDDKLTYEKKTHRLQRH